MVPDANAGRRWVIGCRRRSCADPGFIDWLFGRRVWWHVPRPRRAGFTGCRARRLVGRRHEISRRPPADHFAIGGMKSDTGKETFLRNVRQALSSASRPGVDGQPASSSRAASGSADPVADFCKRFADAGGLASVVENDHDAFSRVAQIIENVGGGLILLGDGPPLERLRVGERLKELGHQVNHVQSLTAASARDVFFRADLSISGVDYLIAETGSIVIATRPEEPRSLSLLPPVHVAVADEAQLLPDLFDLFDAPVWQERGGIPSCLTLITGPSKTGDIELRLVTGVHGPGEIHVVLIRAGS